ncbi:MAG: hypothetical protein KBT13_00705 [Bacteroidales bacterium]|nr:hypothetical protein [Candidatus Sodaliphilus limicaballi]
MRKMTMMCMAALLLMAVSCKKEKANEEYTGEGFRATTESHTGEGDSKTQLLDNLSVTWCDGDIIKVFSSTDSDGKKFSAASAGTIADFNPVDAVTDAFFTPSYTAFYPESAVRGTNQIYLDGTQHYTMTDGVLTFASGENPMAAKSDSKVLPFKNLCGILKFQLYSASECKVKSLCVTSLKSGEQLWGTGTVTFDGTNATLGTLTGGSESITLDCGEGVDLSTSEGTPTEFMFVIPDGALSEGFTVTVTDTNDKTWSKTTTANNMITKSKIKAMPKLAVTTHTPVSPSEVTVTASCSNENIYTLGGSVTVPEGIHTCEFGLVYSATIAEPTLDNGTKVEAGTDTFSDTKTFTADITGLTVGTTYHVRAYAMIDGVTYSTGVKDIVGGNPMPPLSSSWTNGKSPKQFSVSATEKVYFSQGNLQYIGSVATPYWKFAEHQFDYLGNNGQGSDSKTADRDLFGWGTSGYHQGYDSYNVNYQPWATSTSMVDEDYNYYGYGPSTWAFPEGPSGMTPSPGIISGSYYDWGVNCAISNGGNQAGKWRTLTMEEWSYLIETRTDGSGKLLYGEGKVGSCIPGLIILPDDWKWEGDVESFEANWKPGETDWPNVYSYSEWAKMEAAGAVFLPIAGGRTGTSLNFVGADGNYWSSSPCSNIRHAYYLYFNGGCVKPQHTNDRYFGFSVRLVSEN